MAVIPNSCRECNQHDCVNHQFEWFIKNNPNINNANSVSPACPLLKEVSQEPTTKNDLGVDCVDKRKVMCYTCRFCKMDICDGKPYCSLREKGGKCYSYDSWDSQENVLDKIRAEIENGTHHFLDGEPIIEIKEALQIIDKYKAEIEE